MSAWAKQQLSEVLLSQPKMKS
ncbi:hypothetical protein AGR7B_pAt0159 [Agrobacterium deltaense RV3]|nr:hypothetical protein AGR7B_pAt0159 [Agrobacterium deltaense RV3]